MMETTLRPGPQFRHVVREQFRAVGLALSREMRIAILIIAVVTVLITLEMILRDVAVIFQPDSFDAVSTIGLLIPFAVWKGDRPFAPTFLWTLPVDRRRLALAKVFAGWIWLMAVIAGVVLWEVTFSLVSEWRSVEPLVWETRPTLWLGQFSAATELYLIGSALKLGLRHPMRWVFGTLAGFFLVGILTENLGRTPSGQLEIVASSSLLRAAVYGPYGVATFLGEHAPLTSLANKAGAVTKNLSAFARFATSTLIWLTIGAALLWAALSRHGERRRR